MHLAGAALPVIAALLGAGASNGLTDAIQARRPRIDAKLAVLTVNAQRNRDRARDIRPVPTCRGRGALPWSVVRVRRRAHRNDRGGRGISRRPKKCPATWI